MLKKSSIWLNKYVITLLIFAVVIGFVGDQSLRVRIKKAIQIRRLERQLDAYNRSIEESRRTIEYLHSTDSMERYAREHYLMHADNEDVFLVEEDD